MDAAADATPVNPTYTPGQRLASPVACFLCGQAARVVRRIVFLGVPEAQRPKDEAAAVCAACDTGGDVEMVAQVRWVRRVK